METNTSATLFFCEWKQSIDEVYGDMWQTNCDNEFIFTNGDPEDNGFQWCPYCGNALVVLELNI